MCNLKGSAILAGAHDSRGSKLRRGARFMRTAILQLFMSSKWIIRFLFSFLLCVFHPATLRASLVEHG